MAQSRRLQISLAFGICCAVGPPALFAAPAAHTFTAAGVKIRYFVEGQGEPVVLIHGLHSSAAMNWMAVGIFAELAKDHQVIALDLPGHGQSDKPNDEKAYGVQLVKDIVALLDQLQIKQAHIVGYSLGGMIAVKLLVMYPERALSGTIGGMGWLREGSPLQRVWEQMPGRKGMRTPQVVTHTMGQFAVTEKELKDVTVPVEVIVGDRDPVRRMYVVPLHTVRPDWPVVEIEKAGHITCVTNPEFRDELARWVRKQSKR
jgi:pimeloyl-ACP methyl ester carboxylesterase